MKDNINIDIQFNIPIVFCTFKRLEPVIQVFNRIKALKPQKLYLVSDGPRTNVEGEDKQVVEVRNYIEKNIDWPCEIEKIYAAENMGCGKRISSALDYVFSKEEWAIILEDDCLPDKSFFTYCEDMLTRFKDDERIISVSGTNSLANKCGELVKEDNILFSHIPFVWGWATWKRAWDKYDFRMQDWKAQYKQKKKMIRSNLPSVDAYRYYMAQFRSMYHLENPSSWAFQLTYCALKNNMFSVVPSVNLVENLGFKEGATHTEEKPEWICNEVGEYSSPKESASYANVKEAEPCCGQRKARIDTINVEWNREFDEMYCNYNCRPIWPLVIKSYLGFDVNKPIMKQLRKG